MTSQLRSMSFHVRGEKMFSKIYFSDIFTFPEIA